MARKRLSSLKVRTSAFQAENAGFKSRESHYGDCSSSGRAVDCGSTGCEFESRRAPYGQVNRNW